MAAIPALAVLRGGFGKGVTEACGSVLGVGERCISCAIRAAQVQVRLAHPDFVGRAFEEAVTARLAVGQ